MTRTNAMARAVWRSLLPHEHGAYGQVSFPLIAAFAVSDFSVGGVLVAVAAVSGFLAHEPAMILLGRRGPRAYRERCRVARWWLVCCLAAAAAAAAALVITAPAPSWTLAVPVVPAAALVAATALGYEKSWYGEIAAALAFAATAVPICTFAGASVKSGFAVAIPFALLFVSATLSVHVVILQGRGRDPRATRATRTAALTVAAVSATALGIAASASTVPVGALVAAMPGLLTAAAVAARPPAPTKLRDLGWLLIGVSVLTTVLVVVI
jgi:hypothetical protein